MAASGPDERADLAHRNLMEVNELLTRASGGVAERRGDELVFAGTHDFPMLNGAMRERGEGDAAALVGRAAEFFGERGRGWSAYIRPDDTGFEAAAREAGLKHLMDYPEMVCAGPIAEPGPPSDIVLRPVGDGAAARDYWTVCEQAYRSLGFPPGVFDSFPADLLLGDAVGAWLAYLDDSPCAGAMIAVAGAVGMVCWVATLESHRGRGLAALCTIRATNAAFERGAELASLQASAMGERVYLALGYEELYRYRLYVAVA